MKKYEQIQHTADLGAEIYGKGLRELFRNAAFAMFDMIADLPVPEISIKLEIKAMDTEDLLIEWLNELLYRASEKNIVFSEFDITMLEECGLQATVLGGKPVEIYREIKAATYHDVKIRRNENGYAVTVIFDV